MAVSVRLDDDTRKLLNRLARERKISRSEAIRQGIHLLAKTEEKEGEANPYESIRDLIGRIRGGPANLSEQTGARFRQLLSERRRRS